MEVVLYRVDRAEHLADGLIQTWYFQSHIVAILLEKLEASKYFAEGFDDPENVALGKEFLRKDSG